MMMMGRHGVGYIMCTIYLNSSISSCFEVPSPLTLYFNNEWVERTG